MQELYKYKREAELHKREIWHLSQDPLTQEADKKKFVSAYKYGTWLNFSLKALGIIGLLVIRVKYILPHLWRQRFAIYLCIPFPYWIYHNFTTAHAWKRAYFKARNPLNTFVALKTFLVLTFTPDS